MKNQMYAFMNYERTKARILSMNIYMKTYEVGFL
jgi:hypothetical protein